MFGTKHDARDKTYNDPQQKFANRTGFRPTCVLRSKPCGLNPARKTNSESLLVFEDSASHFAKRILEVLILHDFSGSPTEEGYACVVIGGFYARVIWLFVRDGARARPQEVAGGAMLSPLGHQILKSPRYGDFI
jgi:hypothetical protein